MLHNFLEYMPKWNFFEGVTLDGIKALLNGSLFLTPKEFIVTNQQPYKSEQSSGGKNSI